MTDSEQAKFWRRAAGRVARRVNAGWWLQVAEPGLFLAAVLAASGLLFLRRAGWPTEGVWLLLGLAVAAVAGGAWMRARSRFFDVTDGLTRLDAAMGLRCRLSAAHQAVGPWPPPRDEASLLHWKWDAGRAPAAGVLLLGFAAWVPIVKDGDSQTVRIDPPPALQEVAEWLDQLEQAQAVEPEVVEELRAQVQEVIERPQGEWFEHSALEAAGSLRDKVRGGMAELEREASEVGSAWDALVTSPGARAEGAAALEQALGASLAGPLPLSRELAEQLRKGASAHSTGSQAARQRLEQLKQVCGSGSRPGSQQPGQGSGSGQPGDQPGDGRSGSRPGSGAPSRGPGEAPLQFGAASEVDPGRLETLSSELGQPNELGDIVNQSFGVPEPDPDAVVSAGGGASNTKGAGRAAWNDRLSPREKGALERFFR